MAEMVLTPSQSEGKEANFIQKFGRAFIHGDVFTKLSLVVWGVGYIGHGQLIKALLVTLVNWLRTDILHSALLLQSGLQ